MNNGVRYYHANKYNVYRKKSEWVYGESHIDICLNIIHIGTILYLV